MIFEEVHIPVLLNEILQIFDPQPGQTYIDATVDGGGHARAIAERVESRGKVLGIDWDCELISKIKNQISNKNVELVCGNYRDIAAIARRNGFGNVNGILFDLGFSSYHIEQSGRGFSFQKDEPLDMRYSPRENRVTAEEIVNRWPEEKLANLLQHFGGERFSRRIARGIVNARRSRKIISTIVLAEIVSRSIPSVWSGRRLDPATRTFQALRIAVNEELESLEHVLPEALSLLAPSGKLAVISFHSLEERVVKKFMNEQKKKGVIGLLVEKSIRPVPVEITANPRSRSARLRAAIKL